MAKSIVTNLRHEIKLLIPYADYVSLANKLSPICEKDKFTRKNGDYAIRSLYLDDFYHSSYVEKISGTDNRTKYRIRIYNYSDHVIKLEKKEKYGARIKKTSCPISRDVYDAYMRRDFEPLGAIDNPLAREVYALSKSKGLAPDVIVDYDREAYVHPLSNTRITFDKFLHSGITGLDIFDPNLSTLAIFPNGSVILEVKYDTYFPAHLAAIIASARGNKMALSKFSMCKQELSKFDLTSFYATTAKQYH